MITNSSRNLPLDSLEHRAQVRANLAGDKEWIERYFSKILPMMSSQENSVLSVIPDVTFSHSHDEGVYQLQTLQCHNSRVLPLTLMESGAKDFLVTAFKTIIGERDQIILLWKHSSLSAAINFSTQQQSRNWVTSFACYSYVNKFPYIFL